jgi:hypothetical protein
MCLVCVYIHQGKLFVISCVTEITTLRIGIHVFTLISWEHIEHDRCSPSIK